MEEKESTVSISGSPGNTESGSPQPMSSSIPHVFNMNVEYGAGAIAPPPVAAAAVAAMAATPGSSGGGQGSLDLFGKKKRGRPRKYDADGNLNITYKQIGVHQGGSGFSLSPSEFSSSSSKRGRGRPAGSGNWQLLASLGDYYFTEGTIVYNVVSGVGDFSGALFGFWGNAGISAHFFNEA